MATPAERWTDAWFRAWSEHDSAGTTVTLAGVSVLHFDAAGLVTEQRDYWHQEDGAQRPPADWGPVRRHGSFDAGR